MSRTRKSSPPKSLFSEEGERGKPEIEPELLAPLQEYCTRVGKIFADLPARQTFTPNGPQEFTVKTRFGTYRTEGFNGSEELKPMHAYVGKSGKIIYCFRPWQATDYSLVEIKADHIDRLVGFKAMLDDKVDQSDEDIAEKMKRDQEQKRKDAEKRLTENPVFGSW